MSSQPSSSERIAWETNRRTRLAVPAVAGGILYLIGAILLNAALSALPAVGLLQGLSPALAGHRAPAVSPRAPEVAYLSKHALYLIVSSLLTALAIAVLVLVLVLIVDATRYRRPESWPPARLVVLIAGSGFALVNVVHWVALALLSHSFTHSHNQSSKAVDRALLVSGGLGVTLQTLGLFLALGLAVGMIVAMVGAMRTGLLPRWLAVLGIFSGLLFLPLFGSATFQLIPSFWLAATGILLLGRLPSGDPPAWAAGESIPWPSGAEMRARRGASSNGDSRGGVDGPAEPVMPQSSRARKRKRNR
jgi:hypothetical protein